MESVLCLRFELYNIVEFQIFLIPCSQVPETLFFEVEHPSWQFQRQYVVERRMRYETSVHQSLIYTTLVVGIMLSIHSSNARGERKSFRVLALVDQYLEVGFWIYLLKVISYRYTFPFERANSEFPLPWKAKQIYHLTFQQCYWVTEWNELLAW